MEVRLKLGHTIHAQLGRKSLTVSIMLVCCQVTVLALKIDFRSK